MSKINSRGYDHTIKFIGPDHYRLSWWHDRKVQGSRLRFPRCMSRDTDETGALRFAKKWDTAMPNNKSIRSQP
jgi:hypothetical protein